MDKEVGMKKKGFFAIAVAAVISANIGTYALADTRDADVYLAETPAGEAGNVAAGSSDGLTDAETPIAVMADSTASGNAQGADSALMPGTDAYAPAQQTGYGPTVGGDVNTTPEFGPAVGNGTAAQTNASSGCAYVYDNGLGETLALPSGYYFDNIATYTYDNMVADLSVMKTNYPEMKLDTIGTTKDKRELYHVVVGNPEAKHKILVHAGIHAREYIVSQLAMREIASLLEMQQKGAVYNGCSIGDLLQNTCIHFVPMVDPDGITLVQGGVNALQTDEAKAAFWNIATMDGATDIDKYVRTWKNNMEGVNLNRNFDANWEATPSKVDHPSSMNYKGASAESEVESKALADLTRSLMPDRTISYHTQGRVIYWYFGETGNYKNEGFNLATIVHNNTNYAISNSWAERDAAGFKDWAVQKLDIPSVTIECGIGTSPVEEEQIERIWAENDGILPDLMIDLLCK